MEGTVNKEDKDIDEARIKEYIILGLNLESQDKRKHSVVEKNDNNTPKV